MFKNLGKIKNDQVFGAKIIVNPNEKVSGFLGGSYS